MGTHNTAVLPSFLIPTALTVINPSAANQNNGGESGDFFTRGFLARFKGWRAACFVANPHFIGAFGHSPVVTKPASNADLRGAFLVYDL